MEVAAAVYSSRAPAQVSPSVGEAVGRTQATGWDAPAAADLYITARRESGRFGGRLHDVRHQNGSRGKAIVDSS